MSFPKYLYVPKRTCTFSTRTYRSFEYVQVLRVRTGVKGVLRMRVRRMCKVNSHEGNRGIHMRRTYVRILIGERRFCAWVVPGKGEKEQRHETNLTFGAACAILLPRRVRVWSQSKSR